MATQAVACCAGDSNVFIALRDYTGTPRRWSNR